MDSAQWLYDWLCKERELKCVTFQFFLKCEKWRVYLKIFQNLPLGPPCHSSLSPPFFFFLPPSPFFFLCPPKRRERTRERVTPPLSLLLPWNRPKLEELNEELESRSPIHSVGKSPLYFSLISSFRISRFSVKTRKSVPFWIFRVFVVSKVFNCWFRVSICNQKLVSRNSPNLTRNGCHYLEMTNWIGTKTRIETIRDINPRIIVYT